MQIALSPLALRRWKPKMCRLCLRRFFLHQILDQLSHLALLLPDHCRTRQRLYISTNSGALTIAAQSAAFF